jgi:uncharacterized membrane protein
MTYLIAYVAALAVFLLADMVWLGLMVSRIYRPALGDFLLSGVNIPPAVIFYLLYPAGLVIFAIVPAIRTENVVTALILGSLFGLFTYGTYDLTNQATLRHWTTLLTIADMGWGSILGGLSSASAAWIVLKLFRT